MEIYISQGLSGLQAAAAISGQARTSAVPFSSSPVNAAHRPGDPRKASPNWLWVVPARHKNVLALYNAITLEFIFSLSN